MIRSEIGPPKLRFNRLGGAAIARRFNPRNNRNQSRFTVRCFWGSCTVRRQEARKVAGHTEIDSSRPAFWSWFGFIKRTLFRGSHGINCIISRISSGNGVGVVSFYAAGHVA
jgi:hypothetical protein